MTGKNILKSLAQALLAFILMFASSTACAKIDSYRGLSLELSEVSENLTVGQTARIEAEVRGDNASSVKTTIKWQSLNPSVLSLNSEGNTATVKALKGGVASIRVSVAECESLNQKLTFKIKEEGDGILRILAIGNSFSQDAVEQYLYELFKTTGQEVVIGNLYIGGCSLEKHYNNIKGDKAAYEYRKVVNGQKTNLSGVKISTALEEEPWDYVSIQQVSGLSGQFETCTPYLPEILNYVRSHSKFDVKLIWHSTWAYSKDSTHGDFPKYNKDQMTMYNAIVEVGQKVMANTSYSFDLLVPSGTAIQNGRTSSLGDTFNRDGYHLEVNYGRYTAACTWFEAISGKNVEDVSYAPSTVSAANARIARAAAHRAVVSPYSVTELTGF